MDITCSLCTVYEHDMDVMLMQAILTDPGFLGLFIDKTDWSGLGLRPIHAELANSDVSLGETDITVILSDGISQYALLLEDKIDAVAQPDQHDRYVKRGDKAVRKGLYTDYKVFIVCQKNIMIRMMRQRSMSTLFPTRSALNISVRVATG